jgi:hypothetical protein
VELLTLDDADADVEELPGPGGGDAEVEGPDLTGITAEQLEVEGNSHEALPARHHESQTLDPLVVAKMHLLAEDFGPPREDASAGYSATRARAGYSAARARGVHRGREKEDARGVPGAGGMTRRRGRRAGRDSRGEDERGGRKTHAGAQNRGQRVGGGVRARAERGAGGEHGADAGAPRGEVRGGGRVGEARLHDATLWAPAADGSGRVGLNGAGEAVPGDEGAERAVGPRGEPAPAAPP